MDPSFTDARMGGERGGNNKKKHYTVECKNVQMSIWTRIIMFHSQSRFSHGSTSVAMYFDIVTILNEIL